MSHTPRRQRLLSEVQRFECRDCGYTASTFRHRSRCPDCNGTVDGPITSPSG